MTGRYTGACTADTPPAHLDDLHELVDAAVPGEDGLSQQQLREHAAGGPDVDVGRVVGGAEDELGRAVIP